MALFCLGISAGCSNESAWSRHMRAGESAGERGDYAQAVQALEAAVKKAQSFGESDPRLPESLTALAMLYDIQGRYAEADALYRRVRDAEKTGDPKHAKAGIRSFKLGEHFKNEGRYSAAEVLLKRALALDEEALGKEHSAVATDLNQLGELFIIQGRYSEAEAIQKRALAINEKMLGSNHPRVASDLNNLAVVYHYQGRYAQAEPLHKRALAIREKALGPDNPNVATDLFNLAELYRDQGRYSVAEALLKRSLAIAEKKFGAEDFYVARSLGGLAGLYKLQRRFSEAGPLYARSLAIIEKQLGPEHVNTGIVLNAVAELLERQGRFSEAEPVLKRALAILEKTLGPEHPFVASALETLAMVYQGEGRYGDALTWIRKATSIYRARATQASREHSPGAVSEQRRHRRAFVRHIGLVDTINASNPAERDQLVSESFEVAQLARTSDAAIALTKMAARFARGDDELARLARARQDALTRWQVIDAELVKAAIRSQQERDAKWEVRLREELAGLGKQLAGLDGDLERRFPEYKDLTSPQPLPLEEAQKLVGDDEALVSYLVDEQGSYLWVLRKGKVDFRRIDIGRRELDRAVRRLREALEPFAGMTLSEIRAFPVKQSYELYRRIFAPAEPLLKGAAHVMVVPDGALQSLPFGVLVTQEPKEAVTDFSGYREVRWLARKYALSVLPSDGSLRALRRFAKGSLGNQPFTGFGDPLLGHRRGGSRGLAAAVLFSRGAVADVEEVRRLPRLPETADELFAVASALGADKQNVNLREAATETRVKRMNLSGYRTLAFSTHGLMAGEFKGLAEPALVLTPPSEGSELDDGLLTASEVARLKLNADWVILSACNTAAADGTPGAEGLSGLARAFLYAGSRALLVSHWAVSSDAAVELTTKMFKASAEYPGIGKAEALRRSMLSLMNSEVKPYYAHPMFWGPFVVVGEGGQMPSELGR
jgi:CHAT domain-containing protein